MMQWFGDSVKVGRRWIGKAAAAAAGGWLYNVLLKNYIGLACVMKQAGRTYTAQPKNLAIHSPSFSSENMPNKERGGDFEMNKREIPLAFISFT
jgi:hypothetical protein